MAVTEFEAGLFQGRSGYSSDPVPGGPVPSTVRILIVLFRLLIQCSWYIAPNAVIGEGWRKRPSYMSGNIRNFFGTTGKTLTINNRAMSSASILSGRTTVDHA